ALMDHNGIDAFTHAWDCEFKRDPAGTQIMQLVLEERALLDPGIALELIEVMRVLCGEVPEDSLRLLLQKARHRGSVISLVHGRPNLKFLFGPCSRRRQMNPPWTGSVITARTEPQV